MWPFKHNSIEHIFKILKEHNEYVCDLTEKPANGKSTSHMSMQVHFKTTGSRWTSC